MAKVTIDTSEVRAYAKDLGRFPAELSRHAVPALKKGAQNIKKTMHADMQKSASFGHLASAITYDEPTATGDGYEVEIGPVKKHTGQKKAPRHGANIAYFGTYKGGGTVRDPRAALEEEIPNFEREVDKLVDGLF